MCTLIFFSLRMVSICDRIWEKGALSAKSEFLSLFNLHVPFQSSESPRLQTSFVSSLDLLLHRSNVRSLNKPPIVSGAPPKRGIKPRFSNAIDAGDCPAHTGSGWGSWIVVSVVGWWKNIHARFEVCSCSDSRDISVVKQKFGKCVKCTLFSNPVTYMYDGGHINGDTHWCAKELYRNVNSLWLVGMHKYCNSITLCACARDKAAVGLLVCHCTHKNSPIWRYRHLGKL